MIDAVHLNTFELGQHGRHPSNVCRRQHVPRRPGRGTGHASDRQAGGARRRRAARHHPPQGDRVDPFGGSGTTLIAAEKTGRKARLVEIDPKYCDVIIQRWQAYTGKAARLDASSDSFEDVALARAAASGPAAVTGGNAEDPLLSAHQHAADVGAGGGIVSATQELL